VNNNARENNFNLIRFILALLVIFGHSPELIDGNRHREWLTQIFDTISFGEFAVDGFFLLSGYLIAQSWNSDPRAAPFLKKRLLRIYPGFITSSLICALIVGPLASSPSLYFESFDSTSFLQGIAFLSMPVTPDVFKNTWYPALNGSMWTISKEFTFYLLILVAGVTGILRFRHIFIAFTVATFALLTFYKLKNISFVPDLRLASFFLSGACYYLYRDYLRYKGKISIIMTAIVVLFMFWWRSSELVLATVGGYVIFYIANIRSTLLSHFNRLPDVSYGVYLYGWPIQKLLLWYYPSMSPWTLFISAAPLAILMGTVSWYLIEKPALRFKGPAFSTLENQKNNLA
jgi:peptidoglycan/LPS O-acetylase OafA/YrhL